MTCAFHQAEREAAVEALAAADPDLGGVCGYCDRYVTNRDNDHRVTPILQGGRGVECVARGDYKVAP